MTRTLVPLVLVPYDQTNWNTAWPAALDAALYEALSWWYGKVDGWPFAWYRAQAIGGQRPRAYYSDGPYTQERVRAELSQWYPQLLNESGHDQGLVYVVYLACGWDPYNVPGNVIGTSPALNGGPPCLVVQSSGSLDAFLGLPADDWVNTRAPQIGALTHELGHALSLPHPVDAATQAVSVMWGNWSLFENVGLTEPERAQAAAFAQKWS